jgi:hypothetical protein
MIFFFDECGTPWVAYSFTKSENRYSGKFAKLSNSEFQLLEKIIPIMRSLVILVLTLVSIGLMGIKVFWSDESHLHLPILIAFGGMGLFYFVIFYLFPSLFLAWRSKRFYSKRLMCERLLSIQMQSMMLSSSLLIQVVGLARHFLEENPHSLGPDIVMSCLSLYFVWRCLLVKRISTIRETQLFD